MSEVQPRPAIPEADLRRFSGALEAMSMSQGRLERLLHGVFRVWCRLFGWQVGVSGMHRLQRRDGRLAGAGHVVAVAPHRAWVEPFLLLLAWPADAARLVWLADGRTVTRSRWRRWLLPRLGVIPIRGTVAGPRAYAELGAMVLDAGAALAVFPEVGPPSVPDRPRRISPGFAYLALRAGAAVTPVVIGGTHRIVRGSSFSVDVLDQLEGGRAVADLFTPDVRERAHGLVDRYQEEVMAVLPQRTAEADACAPERERWGWLASLFG